MSEQENCSICFEEFEDPVRLPCNHIFCRNCIVEALEQRQSCPICRRLSCNYINEKFLSITQQEEPKHNLVGDPCFVYRIAIHHNSYTQFNFFEKRYVVMVTEALKNDLTFIIDPSYNDCCMKVKLIECQPVQQHSIYVCNVQNIQRLKIIGSSYRDIQDSDSKLKYVTTQPIIDNFDQETIVLYQKLHNCVEKIIENFKLSENDANSFMKMVGNKNETSNDIISQKSLELLQTIKMCENGILKWYFSTDLNGRLSVIINHYESYLNYQQNQ